MNHSVKITILADNKAEKNLDPEHGFSAWIEASGICILFDTGQGTALAGNALKLGIDLDGTDHLVLSHGHYDHGGGIVQVLRQAPESKVHLHPGAVIPRFVLDRQGRARAVGLSRDTVRFLAGLPENRIHWTTGKELLSPDIGLTGSIPRLNPHEDTGGPFFTDQKGNSRDFLPDDQAIWIEAPEGLAVITGCAHSGIINTLNHVMAITGKTKIWTVVGGFHLMNASHSRMEETLNQLRKISPDIIAPCHCTGEKALELIREEFNPGFMPCHAGTVISLPRTGEPGQA